MTLNLREIIDVPGGIVPFDFEPDLSDAVFGSIIKIKPQARAAGSVKNSAGVLTFSAGLSAELICVCARCLKEFVLPVNRQISVFITKGGENGEDPDSYVLHGDSINAGEIIATEFMLATNERLLCREDCAGLCENCGADLNEGPCACSPKTDPRLAVLGQLLESGEKSQ